MLNRFGIVRVVEDGGCHYPLVGSLILYYHHCCSCSSFVAVELVLFEDDPFVVKPMSFE